MLLEFSCIQNLLSLSISKEKHLFFINLNCSKNIFPVSVPYNKNIFSPYGAHWLLISYG